MLLVLTFVNRAYKYSYLSAYLASRSLRALPVITKYNLFISKKTANKYLMLC